MSSSARAGLQRAACGRPSRLHGSASPPQHKLGSEQPARLLLSAISPAGRHGQWWSRRGYKKGGRWRTNPRGGAGVEAEEGRSGPGGGAVAEKAGSGPGGGAVAEEGRSGPGGGAVAEEGRRGPGGGAVAEKGGSGPGGGAVAEEGRSAARSVLGLQERLRCAQEPAEIIKTLEVLQGLDLSLDILVETGIEKTVDSFRKHAAAGNVAKSLLKQWKKLISPESKSGHRRRKNNEKGKCETKSSVSKEIKPSEKPKTSVLAFRSSSSAPISAKLNKEHVCSKKTHQSTNSASPKECDHEECSSSGSKHASQGTNSQAKESEFKESKKVSEKQHSSAANEGLLPLEEKPSKDASKQRNPKCVKKRKQNLVMKDRAKSSSDEEFEPPTMSFEAYLTYDEITNKRKRKACSTGARPKKCIEQKNSSLPQKTSKLPQAKVGVENVKKSESEQSETPSKKAKVASFQELLNTPLPKILPGISQSSPPYAADFTASTAAVLDAPQQVDEIVQFTGQRLNSKMQVYSGSKAVCLSKMLTLYEQCVRVLHNNIELLQEAGDVPFEILEPVLIRCTPEQLFRIEKCNLTFIKETDHLWKKHCQRDFKNESLQEHESWREMYLRLFNQREEKLKILTKNILSAQSEKPKGRQVKMAYMTGAAKPPRNIRRQQEIHGTAGPVIQLHPTEKCKIGIPEMRDRNKTLSNLIPAGNSSSSSDIMIQDGKKPTKKIAPIMKKTLKALRSRVGQR
ncbi:elongin-A-like [Aphelocoma coerulescens]|uniref:elongin-A-like n=1 Tax=Aphelocoma coerulescens TaxID=39617 RepID=UPI0036044B45